MVKVCADATNESKRCKMLLIRIDKLIESATGQHEYILSPKGMEKDNLTVKSRDGTA